MSNYKKKLFKGNLKKNVTFYFLTSSLLGLVKIISLEEQCKSLY